MNLRINLSGLFLPFSFLNSVSVEATHFPGTEEFSSGLQEYLSSILHSEEQPSPLALFPSSHSIEESRINPPIF